MGKCGLDCPRALLLTLATGKQQVLFREGEMHLSFKRAFVTAVNWGPVTVMVRSSACSSAAVKTTAETVLIADAVLCVVFWVLISLS